MLVCGGHANWVGAPEERVALLLDKRVAPGEAARQLQVHPLDESVDPPIRLARHAVLPQHCLDWPTAVPRVGSRKIRPQQQAAEGRCERCYAR